MNNLSRSSARRAAAATAAVALGAGALMAATGTSADALTLSKSFNYSCAVTAGGLPLGTQTVGVAASVTLPDVAYIGQTLPARTTNISLTMPAALQSATTSLLGGVAASGASTDAYVTFVSNGKTQTLKIPSLSAPKTAIPASGTAWVIKASGTVPAIAVPATAKTSATISLPSKFTIAATIYKKDNTTVTSNLSCTGPAALTLGSLPIKPNTAPVAKAVTATTKTGKAVAVKPSATDADGDALTYAIATKPTSGTVVVSGTGASTVFTYTPKAGFTGTDSFTYSASDGKGGVATAKATITVTK